VKKTLFVLTLLALSLFVVSGVMAAPSVQAGEEYTVQAGDWLSKIAEKYYGDVMAYPAIVDATNAKAAADDSFAAIDNPDVIEIGQKLWIPAAAAETVAATEGMTAATEVEVTDIVLTGLLEDRKAEVSGMDWYGDNLIMLPQYPTYFTDAEEGYAFALSKDDIMSFLDGAVASLAPTQISFIAPGVKDKAAGFQGYEAIAFVGDNDVYLTIEAEADDGSMSAYLLRGTIAPDLSAITVDTDNMTKIEPQAGVGNMSEETLIVAGDKLVTLYEANGVGVNASPAAHLFGMDLAPAGTVPLANVEYRLTDATKLDSSNRFWAINYFFPGNGDATTESDPIVETYGEGETHSTNDGVERLVQFQYADSGITMTDAAPIQMKLLEEDLRNWEGLVTLDGRGFLVMTDKYPGTILGFVPYAE